MRPTDIAEVLQSLEAGTFLDKVQAVVSDVAAASVNLQSTGKFSLEFTLKPIGESSQVNLGVKLKYTRPRERGELVETHTIVSPMFVNKGGKVTLMPEDPLKQMDQLDAFYGNDTRSRTGESEHNQD